MTPLIKGWVWNIPFYPCLIHENTRMLKDIFWYDSSQEDAFTKRTEAYEILLPEHLISAPEYAKKYIRDNKERIISNHDYIITTDNCGRWWLRSQILPVRLRLGE